MKTGPTPREETLPEPANSSVWLEEPAEIVEFDPGPLECVEAAGPPPRAVDEAIQVPPFPHPFWHPLRAAGWVIRSLFGIVSLILMLAVVAAIPVLNFLALGYLLEVEGRVGRSGRLRDAFPLLGLAPRIGSIVLGLWLWLFPLRLLAGAAADAALIAPGGRAAVVLHVLTIVAGVLVGVHLCLALARGGTLGCFVRPIKNLRWLVRQVRSGHYLQQAEERVETFFDSLRLKHHFLLGFRGFVGALAWLVIPTLLYATLTHTNKPGEVIVTILGGLLLVLTLAWVPFLQARFAAENRLRAMFELRETRRLFTHAPFAWLTAIVVVYVLSLPLYLLKVALPPDDAVWLVTIVFIVSIYPARVVTGWAYHRAVVKQKPAWFGWRWMSRTLMLPLLGLYVFLLFFTQAIGAHGKLVLFEHHAFLLPVPF